MGVKKVKGESKTAVGMRRQNPGNLCRKKDLGHFLAEDKIVPLMECALNHLLRQKQKKRWAHLGK